MQCVGGFYLIGWTSGISQLSVFPITQPIMLSLNRSGRLTASACCNTDLLQTNILYLITKSNIIPCIYYIQQHSWEFCLWESKTCHILFTTTQAVNHSNRRAWRVYPLFIACSADLWNLTAHFSRELPPPGHPILYPWYSIIYLLNVYIPVVWLQLNHVTVINQQSFIISLAGMPLHCSIHYCNTSTFVTSVILILWRKNATNKTSAKI